MQQINIFLEGLGLNEKEINVYTASLQLGEQPASIVAHNLGLPRSTVSFIFEELAKKGLISTETRKNTRYYSAISPESLEYVLMDRLASAKKIMEDYHEILPTLSALQNQAAPTPRVRYFEGYEGLCRMLDDFCAKDETVLYISGHNMMHPKIRQYTYNVYLPISNKHTNKNKIILNEGAKASEYEQVASKAYDEFIFVDPKVFQFTLTTAVYGNKVAFWSYDPKDMTGTIVENKLIADNMRTVFEVMRRFLKKTR
ncbi:MAG: helix-turn-helix domain-containing protein [Candidatus Gracilibacteria bacterium]